jgi:hypothetical protein
MRAYIQRDGTLVITAETEVEAYALSKWGDDAWVPDYDKGTSKLDGSKILIDVGLEDV